MENESVKLNHWENVKHLIEIGQERSIVSYKDNEAYNTMCRRNGIADIVRINIYFRKISLEAQEEDTALQFLRLGTRPN
jgi:hypothetical protein